jgi:hypothetical protein
MKIGLGSFLLLVAIAPLQASMAFSQESALSGNVTDANGHPLGGVHIWGSPGECCPVKSDTAETSSTGDFRIGRPGQVIHVSKEGFAIQAIVLNPGMSQIHVVLKASNDLNIPACNKPPRGYRKIGDRVASAVPTHDMKVLGGKPDVDYVKYIIKPRRSASALELWFGPYAISSDPDDEQFLNSADFKQRYVAFSGEGTAGVDSSGHFATGNRWRRMAFLGVGGAIYRDVRPQEAALFDRIIDSACFNSFR